MKMQRDREGERHTESISCDGRNKRWRLRKRSSDTGGGRASQRWPKRSGESVAGPGVYLGCGSVLLQGLGQALCVASALGKPKAD